MPDITDALLILFNLLYFVLILSVTSLLIERVWLGSSRWVILPIVASAFIAFPVCPRLIVIILRSLIGPFSWLNFLIITATGIWAGMAVTSL